MARSHSNPGPSFFLAPILIFVFLFSGAFGQNGEALSPNDRLDVFEKVWKSVKDKYYDPNLNGVDWNAVRERYRPQVAAASNDTEFYSVLKQMTGEMGDAHTRFLTPREAFEFKNRQTTTTGIILDEIEGRIIVALVAKDSEAEKAGIRPGMPVTEINGQPVSALIEKNQAEVTKSSSERAIRILTLRRLTDGDPETQISLTLIDASGKSFNATLTRKQVPNPSKVASRKLESGFGYVSISRFFAPAADLFVQEYDEIKDTRGLIIDLRYNGGGSMTEVLKIAGMFIENRKSFGKIIKRKGQPQDIWIDGTFKANYSRPVVVLVNSFSASGSELFASGLQELGRVKVIGTQSCGCLLGITQLRDMKGGGELHLSETGFLSPNGKIYERMGVTPDVNVTPKIDDLQRGIDRGLEEAEKILTEMVSK